VLCDIIPYYSKGNSGLNKNCPLPLVKGKGSELIDYQCYMELDLPFFEIIFNRSAKPNPNELKLFV